MLQPIVSIILPIRNSAHYLKECIDSILGQSLKAWELLAVDDHSTDSSFQILYELTQKDPRVKLLHNQGKGIVDALNTGTENAKSPLIARMDADDIMHEKRLEVQVEYLNQNQEIDLVSCRTEHFPTRQETMGYQHYVNWSNSIIEPREHELKRFIECPMAHPSVIFRKRLIHNYGGYLNGEFPEDYELWLRWFSRGVRMVKIPKVLLRWRDHKNRTSRIDPKYSTMAFQKIKSKYVKLLQEKTERWGNRKIFGWGAGHVARKFISLLVNEGVALSALLDTNPKKIGKKFNNLPIISHAKLPKPKDAFVLILIGARDVRVQVADHLKAFGYQEGSDFIALS